MWHTHQSQPAQYKTDTEALLGWHLSHDDSVDDRSTDARLASLEQSAHAIFASFGRSFAVPGGMYRGTPPMLSATQRSDALAGAHGLLVAQRAPP